MHGTLRRRAGVTATLAFGLIVALSAAIRPAAPAPVAAAQAADATPTAEAAADEGAATSESTPTEGGGAAADATPTVVVPVGSPTPVVPTAADGSVPDAPGVAAGLLADDLKGDALFPSGFCPTGDASGQNVGEGFQLRVKGRCGPNQNAASIAVPGRNISFADGDLALDFKVALGAERAGITLYVRSREGKLLATYLNFQSNEVTLYRRESGINTTLASAGGLADLAIPTDWNRLALRVRGGEAWLLINDETALYAAEVMSQDGGIGIGVTREGNLDDGDEVAVVFRDLTVSAVEPLE